MIKKEEITIFWFRRDLRLKDNRGFHEACKLNRKVLPLFIFDEDILNKIENESDRRVTFIWQSLQEITLKLKELGSNILIKKGRPSEIFEELFKNHLIENIFCNEDYEPYAIKRDGKIREICHKYQSSFYSFKDHVIFRGDEILKKDGLPYRVFTPYKNCWLKNLESENIQSFKVDLTNLVKNKNYFKENIKNLKSVGFKEVENLFIGGEKAAQKLFLSFLKRIGDYSKNRDNISSNSNSHLSPYIRFGCISIRELLRRSFLDKSLGAQTWVSELVWRDFYQMILFCFPDVAKNSFLPKYRNMKWPGPISHFKKWREGKTGFPIVDASMIYFAKTGIMHNRLRMVVASFLVKDLLIDWKKGEEYFSQKLLDFDLASNNGGWQWSASTGCDAQPFFRVFNPTTQSFKFDPEGTFIKKHLPQLKNFPKKYIHSPDLAPMSVQIEARCEIGVDYPSPIINHSVQRLIAIDMFKKS